MNDFIAQLEWLLSERPDDHSVNVLSNHNQSVLSTSWVEMVTDHQESHASHYFNLIVFLVLKGGGVLLANKTQDCSS